jgi:hypothetical protein
MNIMGAILDRRILDFIVSITVVLSCLVVVVIVPSNSSVRSNSAAFVDGAKAGGDSRFFWGSRSIGKIIKNPAFLVTTSSLSTLVSSSTTNATDLNEGDTKTSDSDDVGKISDNDDYNLLKEELDRCNGFIIDPHLHTAPWFNTSAQLIEELETNNISIGILYDPYGRMKGVLPTYDVNTYVHSIASSSNGKIWMLASLNTTHDNWDEHRVVEMMRLREFLNKREVLGCKLAPPHTALPLCGPVMDDIVATVADSPKKLMAIHIGTTPFLGPLGQAVGLYCNGTIDYVDPTRLIPYIEKHPEIKFLLLHSGHEFLPPDSEFYYNFANVDKCIAMAQKYPNVFLSISALFAQTPDGVMKYPGGDKIVQKIKDNNVCHKTFWGSDASYFQNQIRPVLISAIKAMIASNWTEAERTWTLSGLTKELFQIPDLQ